MFVSLELRCVRARSIYTWWSGKAKRPPKKLDKISDTHAHTEVFVSLSLSLRPSVSVCASVYITSRDTRFEYSILYMEHAHNGT